MPTIIAPMGSRSVSQIVSWMHSVESNNIVRTPAKFTASSCHKYSYKRQNVNVFLGKKGLENIQFTESINPEIISMILPEDLNLTWLASKRVTVQEKKKFDTFTGLNLRSQTATEELTESSGDGDDRGDMKRTKTVSTLCNYRTKRFHNNDKVDRTHSVSFRLTLYFLKINIRTKILTE
jgi:hypothetical protein